ncbi:glutathione S-transferase family protein [Pseudogemmobacter faecipullorum]|uniref:Glutathione S-transferase family protein n=1 Tax=Pseudogemmobacter faecipullorum TaxID=2755041 RepID=A0ABS8CGA2_9RHOB|nr:glutathione S-transferase family protein [Pseudogemmobacter faecipullorum]MCB5408417.1 glutathione S-transferase family protein [Pseudogemmobacter faecipullorum]
MLTLYGVYRSRASRPLWLLAETGTPFRHVPVIQAYRLAGQPGSAAVLNTASPEFLAINPQGQIPAMQDDGLLLTESLAITLHIARRYGGDLGPQTPAEQALCEQWALFAATSVEPPALEILLAIESNDQPETRAHMALSAEKLRRPLQRLEHFLTTHLWLVGGRFTVADLNTAECLRYAQGYSELLAQYPAVLAWLARCQARPGFQSMWEKRLAEAP